MALPQNHPFLTGAARRWAVPAAIVAGLLALILYLVLAGRIGSSEGTAAEVAPAKVEAIGTAGLHRIVLDPQAAKRIGLQSVAVRAGTAGRLVVPYSSLVYDANGGSWVFVSPARLTFVRSPVDVARISAGKAILTRGPRAGQKVVAVGTAELYGSEFEFAED